MSMTEAPVELWLTRRKIICREYVARLDKPQPGSKFEVDRIFLRPEKKLWGRSKRAGHTLFILEDPGVYEIQEPNPDAEVEGPREARRYVRIEKDGSVHWVGKGTRGYITALAFLGIDSKLGQSRRCSKCGVPFAHEFDDEIDCPECQKEEQP